MKTTVGRRLIERMSFAVLVAAIVVPVGAQSIDHGDEFLRGISVVDERLAAQSEAEPVEDLLATVEPAVRDRWAAFQLGFGGGAAAAGATGGGGQWVGYVDKRTGRLDFAEGGGIPWVPGGGNRLTGGDIAAHLGGRPGVDLAVLESIARAFLPEVAPMLGVDPASLVLAPGRSGQPADYLWFVDFDVVRGGLPIEGARVVFRVNHGNLIQFGSENLPSPGAAVPEVALTRERALAILSDHVGGVTPWDDFVDPGSLHLVPVALADGRFADGFAFGRGRGLAAVWEFTFRREDEGGTWRARIDATDGALLDFRDVNDYGRVTGGVYKTGPSAGESVLPMPFADVGGGLFANSAGLFFSTGTSSALNGQYVKITDSCGAISRFINASGDMPFGTSAGADCTTPGSGGAGNTHSARTQFYHVNRAKEVGRGWLPSNSWLNAKVTVNTNINQTCNAYWSPSNGTLNFYRSGGGCGNTGELAAVSLHEFGHGFDQNDGNGSSVDKGTGETYGDFTAALLLRSSCIGPGFRTTNCAGYGDACTSCTGIRDIDYAKHTSGAAHTVSNFTQTKCPTSGSYQGPCGREGHCESYVSSEALWDLAARDLPSPNSNASWAVAERLWYLSRATATKAFNCTASGTWTSNGCFTGSFWRTMRAVDDDDGNLNNGIPHGGALYAAFNRHGIACTTDTAASTTFRAVTPPAVPTLTLTGGIFQVTVSWTNSGGGVVYDVYRSEIGCSAGFVKAGNDKTGTSWVDTAVANGSTYYYFVTAQPSGNEAAASNPTTCKSVVPGPPPPPPGSPPTPASLTVTQLQCWGLNSVSWAASSGATYYELYRSPNSSFPTQTLEYSGPNTSVIVSVGSITYLRVRACNSNGCSDYRLGNFPATFFGTC